MPVKVDIKRHALFDGAKRHKPDRQRPRTLDEGVLSSLSGVACESWCLGERGEGKSKRKEEMAGFGDERAGNFVNRKEAAKQGEQGYRRSALCGCMYYIARA